MPKSICEESMKCVEYKKCCERSFEKDDGDGGNWVLIFMVNRGDGYCDGDYLKCPDYPHPELCAPPSGRTLVKRDDWPIY